MAPPPPILPYRKRSPLSNAHPTPAFQQKWDWALKTAAQQEGRDPADPQFLQQFHRSYRLVVAWGKAKTVGKYLFLLSTPALALWYAFGRKRKAVEKEREKGGDAVL